MTVRHIEMTWRCSSCQHRNLGRHKVCQQCQHPKDRSEKYEMPADPSKAVSVTDADLVRMATAGPNWRCAYCGSDQRNADQSCAECGASALEAEPAAKATAVPQRPAKKRRWPLILGLVGATGTGGYLYSQRTRDFQATVDHVSWTQSIVVERYRIWSREGWKNELPREAFEVRSQGQRIHHYDKVLDGYDTEYYTERVADGETCHDEPQTCSETCSDNSNGFATCRTTCSGGGRRCTTNYRSEQRSRQVPRYRDEPRYAEHAAYRIWDWGVDRTLSATGTRVDDLRWPTAEAKVGEDLGDREQEREKRVGTYAVTLRYDDGEETLTFAPQIAEFPRFAPGTTHALRLKGSQIWVDPVAREKQDPN
jgi:hypothetical protein